MFQSALRRKYSTRTRSNESLRREGPQRLLAASILCASLVSQLIGTVVAQSSPTDPAATTGNSSGAEVSFLELEGRTIEAMTTTQQIIRREGRQFPVRLEVMRKIVVGANDKLDWTPTLTSHTP